MTPQFPPPDRPTDIYGAAMPNQPFSIEPDPALLQQVKSGANWFYWIGALSLVNSAISHFGGSISFVVGLGISQVADVILRHFGTGGMVIAIAFDVFVASICALFGWLANKRMQWAFWLGMALYAVDGLIYVYAKDFLSIAFHVYALFFMFKGAQAAGAIRRMEN